MEHVAGFKFEHRGPVSPAELEEAAARDVKDQIAKLPPKVRVLLLKISLFLELILLEHIDMKNSLNFKLQIYCI